MCIRFKQFPLKSFDKCILVHYTIHHKPEQAMPNVTVSLTDELMSKARAAAEEQFRSLSQHVSFLITQDDAKRARRRRIKTKKPATV